MSMLDYYRRNVIQKTAELSRLEQDKAKEYSKVADLTKKINDANLAISRTNSTSAINSKKSEIQRYQNDLSSAHKKIADFETKILKKRQEIYSEQKKADTEEVKEQKKRTDENIRQQRERAEQDRRQAEQMRTVSQTLSHHTQMHNETSAALERLQSLPEKIVVLFLAANPLDQQNLRLDEEARAIHEMITKAKHRDSVRFETRWAVRSFDVLQAINELNPTIVHFSGHGSDADQIIFQDSSGNAKPVSKEAIVQTMMVASENLRLVFFNTCYSFNQANSVTQYIEAAVGMNTSIGDDAARIFAAQFYSSIGFGHSVQKSFNQAKAAVMLESIPEENTPELFVQEGLDANDIVIVRPASSY